MVELIDNTESADSPERRGSYFSSLTAPQDGMWETLTNLGRQLVIRSSAGEDLGFISLDTEGRLLRFQPAPIAQRNAAEVFAALIACEDVTGAIVSTADPLFASLSFDHHAKIAVHTYLYRDDGGAPCPLDGGRPDLELVEASELTAMTELQRAQLDSDPGDWLRGHLQHLIGRGELYALRRDGEVLATGEARVSDTQPPYVDLGVITVRAHRRSGVASHLLTRLKAVCYERGQIPICSTTVENIGSQRAIERAGFSSIHRLLEVTF